MNRITIGQLYPEAGKAPVRRTQAQPPSMTNQASKFDNMLQSSMVKLSHHAEMRLQQRGIELKPEQMAKLQGAIDKAAMKGSKESLVVCDNMAFIINVKSRTIVTAMDRDSMKENVFTQIDSAVILS
ncbi:TIGR02530 family flagellar biosynthesis protein [Paenibacillus contaminans]|uniref:Flagellar biosynthesis protein n=1 Tax=Paenibacillus contaminans TaxID=450362 RepID=A0A329MRV9_9BACL|nr:TIGR02530 family flagellar biosynthesis protein [Paenibacillus contaminans]RAV22711.1 flagellar biosynthesis protein [Paenibacillus contaminans]